MKLLVDFLPIVLFFMAYKWKGIYAATLTIMIVTALQVIYTKITKKKVETVHIVTLVLLLVFGGATLILQDEMFIKWKVSVVNWLFALTFIGSHFIGDKTIIERMMSNAITLPKEIWTKLNISWSIFFTLIGVTNLYVILNYDTNTWVNFKLFGVLGATIIFIIIQSIVMTKYIKK